MRFYWTMPTGLRANYENELRSYDEALAQHSLHKAWRHLERAHIIGQAWSKQHTYIHWLMFKFGIKIKNKKEILGQIPRLFIGGVKSFVGVIPTGNTGGSDVPPLKKMDIPDDILQILKPYRDI
ncbi:MAG TPA: DUF3703 domain-containing protein [Ferruginibacter sp.]|nr:DUF3703 domain-containing protein [Ferruginibacter sp.]